MEEVGHFADAHVYIWLTPVAYATTAPDSLTQAHE